MKINIIINTNTAHYDTNNIIITAVQIEVLLHKCEVATHNDVNDCFLMTAFGPSSYAHNKVGIKFLRIIFSDS